MIRRLCRAGGVVAIVVASSQMVWTAPVGAAPTLQGAAWWSRTQPPPGAPVPLPTAPTVPPGGLMVQGGADDPSTPEPDGGSAIAAVRYTLDPGQANPILTLTVHKDGSATPTPPVILACQAGSAWNSGGPQTWDTKPSPDCSQSVQGQVAADGATVIFPLGPLQFGNEINVVLVPGVVADLPPGANSSVFTLVFEGPTASNVTTSAGSAPSSFLPPSTFTPTTSSSSFSPGGNPSSFASPSAPAFSAPAAALPSSEQGLTATAPITNAATTPVVSPTAAAADKGNSRLWAVFVLAAGAAVVLWTYRQPGVVVPVPQPVPGAAPIGGLGRFARAREGVAPRLT